MGGHQLDSKRLGLGALPALLVVDAQLGFTDPQSPLSADFTAEINVLNRLMGLAQTKNWPIFMSRVVYREADEAAVFREKLPALNTLVAGSPWVEMDSRLSLEGAHVFDKLHASAFHGTTLDDQLKEADIDSLLIGGFTTSGCVRASAVDGLQYGYRTLIVEDATGDRDAHAHRANLSDFALKYGDVCRFDELVSECVE